MWKESTIHILSSFEKLFAYEDLYNLENELIIRVRIVSLPHFFCLVSPPTFLASQLICTYSQSVFHGILETQIQVDRTANMNFLDPDNPLHTGLPLLAPLRELLFAFFEKHFADAIGQIGEFDVAVAFVNMLAALVRHKYPVCYKKI